MQNFKMLLSHHVDGIIWNKEKYSITDIPDDILPFSFKIFTLNSEKKPSAANPYFSYSELGYAASNSLIRKGHRCIGCLSLKKDYAAGAFVEGIRKCLFDHQISEDDDVVWRLTESCDSLWLQAHTGIICFDSAAVEKMATMTEYLHIMVPEEISVVGIDTEHMKIAGTQLSSIARPFEELGSFAADGLITAVESGKTAYEPFQKDFSVSCFDSIVPPKKTRRSHFVIMGTINVDTLMLVDKQPEPGETISVRQRVIMPGGKGLNQSLGVTKLGASAALISALGTDYDGRQMFQCLKSNSVCTDGVTLHDNLSTGHAYVFIQRNAESNISVFDGANSALTSKNIDQYENLFENVDYCLLQTELDQNLVLHAAELAHRHDVKVILKPCAVTSLLPELVQNTDILVPNVKEANELLPNVFSLEKKAKIFRKQGAKTVIITLGEKGCFLQDDKHEKYFPAARITPVDTTGAADAFISTLAFYLSIGKDIEEAIQYATCAAGLSTTRYGVPPALVNRETLELYYFKNQNDFRRTGE
ncbi:PfkB family carbohydrate kinase [Caproicibacter fermentans]|nr:PfkB family carbohydrate kinase [Caproicibacter fermentans]OCN00834.1 hypothetical protein A7X67_08695 [Clostridium sp. W14A]